MRPQLLQGCNPDIWQHYSPLSQFLSLISPSIHKASRLFVVQQALLRGLPMVRSIFQWNSALAALILLCCLFFTQPFCKASGSKCFFRDGSSNTDFPCYPNQTESFCCAAEWACLPNRICATTTLSRDAGNIDFARGSCTDSQWDSDQCPYFCLKPS